MAGPAAIGEAAARARPATPSRQTLTLLATILASSLSFIDATVVNVALPTIARDLDIGLALQQWVVLAYSLALASLYIVGGAIGDRYGRRRVFLAATAGFAAASVAAGLAPNAGALVAARVLQGIAGAFLTTNSLALLRATYGAESGKAIGTWTAWTGVTSIAGPLLGGGIVQSASWRYIFFINLPFAAVAVALAWAGRCREVQASPEHRQPLNLPAAVAIAAAFGGLTYALVEGADGGLASVWWAIVLAVGGLGGFALSEVRAGDPLLPRELLGERNFIAANLATLLVYAGLGASTFYLALYLQSAAVGLSPIGASVTFVPVTFVMLFLSRRFGRLADSRGPRRLLVAGPLVMAGGMLAFGAVEHGRVWAVLLPALVVFGLGLSMLVAPITSTALQAVPSRLAGLAAGVNTTLSRLGGLLAIALVGIVISTVFDARAAEAPHGPFTKGTETAAQQSAAIDAFRAAIGVCAGLLLLGALAAGVGVSDDEARAEAKAG